LEKFRSTPFTACADKGTNGKGGRPSYAGLQPLRPLRVTQGSQTMAKKKKAAKKAAKKTAKKKSK